MSTDRVAFVVGPIDILVRDVNEVAFRKTLQKAFRIAPATGGCAANCAVGDIDGMRLKLSHDRASLVTEIPRVPRATSLERRSGVGHTGGGDCLLWVCGSSGCVRRHGMNGRSLGFPG